MHLTEITRPTQHHAGAVTLSLAVLAIFALFITPQESLSTWQFVCVGNMLHSQELFVRCTVQESSSLANCMSDSLIFVWCCTLPGLPVVR